MNVTRLRWTRLICSRDRQELETLKSKLSKVGIPSEIRCNPVAAQRGIIRLEIVVDERDLFRASKVCQGLETAVSADDAAGNPGGGRKINGFVKSEAWELVTEAEGLPSPSAESPREENPSGGPAAGGAEPEGDFAQATGLLEKLVAALEVRFQASEQTLAAAQARLESQTREVSDQQARITNLEKDVSSREAQLDRMAASLTQARAGMEQEKDLRLAAEGKSGDLAAALKSLEGQLAQQARQREALVNERRDEQEQMRVCAGKMNALCRRVSAVLAARERQ